MLTDRELQTLRNLGNEAEAAADLLDQQQRTIECLMCGMPEDGTTPVIRRIAALEEERDNLREEMHELRRQSQEDALQLLATSGQADEHWAEVQRLRGERKVLLGLIDQSIGVIETIQPDDSDDEIGLRDILHKLRSAVLCDSQSAAAGDLFSDHQSTGSTS